MRRIALAGSAAMIVGCSTAAALAPHDPGRVLLALGLASAAYVLAIALLLSRSPKYALPLIVVVALGARAALVFAPAVLEDDVNRYLWDGAVSAEGINPFRFAPQTVFDAVSLGSQGRESGELSTGDREDLKTLASLAESPELRQRFLAINFPSVPTIYPPASQLVFAATAAVAAGELVVMKLLIVAFDLGCAVALLLLLRRRELCVTWLALYLWNPAVLLSFAGSAHMDSIPLCGLLWTIVLAFSRRQISSGIVLGLSVSAKLFPILAWPALRKRLGLVGTASAAVTVFALYGIFWIGPEMFDGLRTFATRWHINAPLFGPLAAISGDRFARIALAVLILVTTAWFARNLSTERQILSAITVALTTLVCCSPAVNPWYVAWLVPFAALGPKLWPALIALSLTVLGSYGRYLIGSDVVPAVVIAFEFAIPAMIAFAITRQPLIISSFLSSSVTKPGNRA